MEQNAIERTTERIPTWALCYIVNSDPTALTDGEIEMINEWMKENRVSDVCPASDQEGEYYPYFTHYPAFGLPAEVVDCYLLTY